MFREPFLRNLFVLALIATTCLPLYTLYILHPSYHEQLVSETEEESARFASYLIRSLGMEDTSFRREGLPSTILEEVKLIQRDRKLLKLRFFSPTGEIIHSTEPDEIGKINKRDYFREIVAQGQIYSKVVRKNTRTADGQVVDIDVVETYVPFLSNGTFGGAIEVYYDITSRVAKINRLTLRTTLALIAVAAVLMLAIALALRNAAIALDDRRRAQRELQDANQSLERRVAERTEELVKSNEQLSNEIAERTLAQTALAKALDVSRHDREKLDGILHSVPDGLLVTDAMLQIIHMNPAAEKILNVSLEKAEGKPLDALPLLDTFRSKLQDCLAVHTGTASFDFTLVEGEGEKVFQTRVSHLKSEDAAAPGVILLIQDVTRERDVEQMKNAFLGMAAHELNTPLTNIIGYTELLLSPEMCGDFDESQRQQFLELIFDKAFALSRLVDDLLDISRIEAGQSLVMSFAECDLADIVRESVQSHELQGEKHTFEVSLPEEPVTLYADCGRLKQILNNLLSNAMKYSPGGGPVRTRVQVDETSCRLVVEDEGIGMSQEQLEHVFDRFYRVDSSDTAVRGVGLGMSVAKHIVEAHQGSIQVESQLGQGTRIVVTLPKQPSLGDGSS